MPSRAQVSIAPGESDSAPAAIALSAICKSFGSKMVLDNVSFAVESGKCLMLVGENGAGKSTVKNLICGLLKSDAGSIAMNGAAVEIDSQRRAQELGIATIHQELSLFPNLSVAENIHLGQVARSGAKIPWKRWREHARAILQDQLDSEIDPDTIVEDLSIGHRQLVEIAKALALDARILILDEPTTCLTLPERNRLTGLVRKLLAKGMAVIYITHFMEEVYTLADQIAVLRDGRVVGRGSPAEIPRAELGRLMAGRMISDTIGALPPIPADRAERLQIENLGDGELVHDVSFAVRSGEVLGLMGLVGSGRSETAELVVGLRRYHHGKILVDQKAVTPQSPRDALALGIALISEDRRKDQAFLERPVRENMTAPLLRKMRKVLGLLSRDMENDTTARLAKTYRIIYPSEESPMTALSGGNQQKVVIARWLETGPKICILDEPTKGIDIGARQLIHQLVADLARDGLAIVLISSDLPELLALSHRLVILHKGRTICERDPARVSASELIQLASSGLPSAAAEEEIQ